MFNLFPLLSSSQLAAFQPDPLTRIGSPIWTSTPLSLLLFCAPHTVEPLFLCNNKQICFCPHARYMRNPWRTMIHTSTLHYSFSFLTNVHVLILLEWDFGGVLDCRVPKLTFFCAVHFTKVLNYLLLRWKTCYQIACLLGERTIAENFKSLFYQLFFVQ